MISRLVRPRNRVIRSCPRVTLVAAGACGVLVGAHDRGVDRDQPVQLPRGVGAGLRGGHQSLPGAVGAPAVMAFPHRLPRSEPCRQVSPWRSCAVPPGDALDHLAVVTPLAAPTTRRTRQQRRDEGPRLVSNYIPVTHTLMSTPPPTQTHAPSHRIRETDPSGRTPRSTSDIGCSGGRGDQSFLREFLGNTDVTRDPRETRDELSRLDPPELQTASITR
jgi:hypothetical protein